MQLISCNEAIELKWLIAKAPPTSECFIVLSYKSANVSQHFYFCFPHYVFLYYFVTKNSSMNMLDVNNKINYRGGRGKLGWNFAYLAWTRPYFMNLFMMSQAHFSSSFIYVSLGLQKGCFLWDPAFKFLYWEIFDLWNRALISTNCISFWRDFSKEHFA